MAAFRNKPNFDMKDAYRSIFQGSIVGFLSIGWSIFFGVAVPPAIKEKHFIIAAICGLCLVPLMAAQGIMCLKAAWHGISIIYKKLIWLMNTAAFRTTIVDREETYVNNYGYEDSYYVCKLALDMIPSQLKAMPDESVVWAQVSKSLYDKYANKNIISIRYSKEAPFSFLIKGEL